MALLMLRWILGLLLLLEDKRANKDLNPSVFILFMRLDYVVVGRVDSFINMFKAAKMNEETAKLAIYVVLRNSMAITV